MVGFKHDKEETYEVLQFLNRIHFLEGSNLPLRSSGIPSNHPTSKWCNLIVLFLKCCGGTISIAKLIGYFSAAKHKDVFQLKD